MNIFNRLITIIKLIFAFSESFRKIHVQLFNLSENLENIKITHKNDKGYREKHANRICNVFNDAIFDCNESGATQLKAHSISPPIASLKIGIALFRQSVNVESPENPM